MGTGTELIFEQVYYSYFSLRLHYHKTIFNTARNGTSLTKDWCFSRIPKYHVRVWTRRMTTCCVRSDFKAVWSIKYWNETI